MANLIRDDNRVPVIGGVSNTDTTLILPIRLNPLTNRVLVEATISGGLSLAPRTPFNQFGENAAVASASETTLATYTVGAGVTAYIQGFSGVAGVAARYKLKVAGVTVGLLKTSASKPSESVSYVDGAVTASAGQAVIVTGYHGDSTSNEMASNIFGFLV